MQPLQSNASKVNTLHLSNITAEDAGEYICMAESRHGGQALQAMRSAWLEVLPGEIRSDPPSAADIILHVILNLNNSSTGTVITHTVDLTAAAVPAGRKCSSLWLGRRGACSELHSATCSLAL